MPTYSGIVKDDTNAGVSGWTVRAYRRDTGAFLGEVTTSDGSVPPGDGDPHFSSVALLLHMDGDDTSTTFTDSSGSTKTVSVAGASSISTAQSKFGGASGFFDGASRISVPASSDFVFTGDFTIEAFVRSSSSASNAAIFSASFGAGAGGFEFYCRRGGGDALQFQYFDGSNYPAISDFEYTNINDSVWRHLAICRESGTLRIFINGVALASGSVGIPIGSTGASFTIGGAISTGYHFNGYIDECRVTNGVARYSSNFTPPASKFPDSSGVAPAVGSYSINTPHIGEVQMVYLDDAGGVTHNDKIVRVIPA